MNINSMAEINMKLQNKQPDLPDWLIKFRKEYADVLDDVGFDITPSRECPDYSKDPWA